MKQEGKQSRIFTPRLWHLWLVSLLAGIGAGAILNVAEAYGIPGASDFGNYLGLWIFLITMIAA